MCCRRKKQGTQAVAKDPSWFDWNPEIPNHCGLIIEFLKKYFEIFLKIWLLNSWGILHLQVWLSRRRCSRYRGFSLAQPVIKPAAVEVAEMAMEFWDYGMVQPPAQIRFKSCSIIHISTIYHESWSITIYILESIIFHCGVVQFSCVLPTALPHKFVAKVYKGQWELGAPNLVNFHIKWWKWWLTARTWKWIVGIYHRFLLGVGPYFIGANS